MRKSSKERYPVNYSKQRVCLFCRVSAKVSLRLKFCSSENEVPGANLATPQGRFDINFRSPLRDFKTKTRTQLILLLPGALSIKSLTACLETVALVLKQQTSIISQMRVINTMQPGCSEFKNTHRTTTVASRARTPEVRRHQVSIYSEDETE